MTHPPLSAPNELCGRLAELLAKATPGPWAIEGRFIVTHDPVEVDMERRAVTDLGYWHMPHNDANAALFVAMKNALPLLLADRTALMAWKEEAVKVIERADFALSNMIRLSNMGLEESLNEPEEMGNFAAFNLAKDVQSAAAQFLASKGDGAK